MRTVLAVLTTTFAVVAALSLQPFLQDDTWATWDAALACGVPGVCAVAAALAALATGYECLDRPRLRRRPR